MGVESAHKSEEAVETGAYLVREGYRSHKLKPYRKAAQAERQLEKANVNVLYQKSLRENPQFASNPLSRWQQKQAIKRQYAAAKHAGQTAGNTAQAASKTGKAARTVKEKVQQAGAFVMRHKKGFLMAGVVLLVFIGAGMIKESKEEEHVNADMDIKSMFILAVATSIDALAVGVTFAFLKVEIVSAVSFIGVITFVCSAAGVKIGSLFGMKYKSKAELCGGIILILIGTKILLEGLGMI